MNLRKELMGLLELPENIFWSKLKPEIEKQQKTLKKIISKLKDSDLKKELEKISGSSHEILELKSLKHKETNEKIKKIKQWTAMQNKKTLEDILKPGLVKKVLITAAALFTIATASNANAQCKTEMYMNPSTGRNEQVINCNGQLHDQSWNMIGSKVGKGALTNPDSDRYKNMHEIPGHSYNQTEPQIQNEYIDKASNYIQKAENERRNARYDEAIKTLEYAVKNINMNPEQLTLSYYALGINYYTIKNKNKSIENFKIVISLDPKSKLANYAKDNIRVINK